MQSDETIKSLSVEEYVTVNTVCPPHRVKLDVIGLKVFASVD